MFRLNDIEELKEKKWEHRTVKTKIMCTIGPMTNNKEALKKMMLAGMSVARLNFSHGTHESHAEAVTKIREVCKETGRVCGILADLKGPEIRTGGFKSGVKSVRLTAGQRFTFYVNYIRGDETKVSIKYWNLPKLVKPGEKIYVDYGLISFTVIEVNDKSIVTVVDNDATLGENKIANVHGMRSNLDNPFLTYQDTLDVDFAVTHGLDFITVSYAAKAADIDEIRALPGVAESGIKLFAKVQNKEAIDNFDGLLAAADGVVISRSSIANEIPVEKVAYVQKTLIRKCNLAGKPVLVANQILNSMEKNPRPTRAECTDIANAVFEGADTIILTNTTGQPNCAYPVKSIKVLRRQCEEVETKLIKYRELYAAIRDYMLYEEPEKVSLAESVTSSAVKTAWDLDATLIVVLSENGDALRYVSKYRPHTPIFCVTSNSQVARQVLLSRGAVPYLTDSIPTGDVLPLVQAALKKAKEAKLVATDDYIIAISGIDADTSRETNMYQVVRCE